MQSVGGRIRERRRELGYSQEKLAELLYMKKSTISAYETGTNDIPSRVLIELARELETSPGFLLTGDIAGILNRKYQYQFGGDESCHTEE